MSETITVALTATGIDLSKLLVAVGFVTRAVVARKGASYPA
ncbi:MAG: hypothetical protein ACRDTG_09825 [Pseudonocardiaceae bacterium]